MTHFLLDPSDSLERQHQKLIRISEALMTRVEQDTDRTGAAYAQFERAAMLEDEVRQRTQDLERTLDLLHESNAALAVAMTEAQDARRNLANAIEAVHEGFALFDHDDKLVMWNGRFALHMQDVKAKLSEGLDFATYIEMVSRSRFLELNEHETPELWAKVRQRRHSDRHVMFNVRLIWDRWLQISEHRTPDGGTVILQTDVTKIMRLERQERGKLLNSQARMLQATLDHLDQGVCIFDRHARLVGWNARISAILAMPVQILQPGMLIDGLVDQMKAGFRVSGATPESLMNWAYLSKPRPPIRFEIHQDRDLVLDVYAQEMPDKGFVISLTDVSAERRAARALTEANEQLERRVMERTLELEDALTEAERANASKTRFVAAASHDLLQPLSASKLYMAAIQEEAPDSTAGQAATKAMNALQSVEEIIDALLNISKLDSGTAHFDVAPLPLARLMERLRDEFSPLAALKGIKLRLVPTSVWVTSDAGFLQRILQNLVANAIRYTQTGKVLVGARRRGNTIRIEVTDTGPGIDEADQDRIFKEFERLDQGGDQREGLGLGLAIVERACAQLGHPLGLVSVPGKGSRFFVSLPLAQSNSPAPVLPPPAAATGRLHNSGLIVLLVENDSHLRRAMSLLIERWGGSVLDVTNGPDALKLLDDIQMMPDAALVDYHLGDGDDGLTLIRRLRALSPTLPVRLMTADRTAELKEACDAAQVVRMEKPLDTNALEQFLVGAIPAAAP